MFSIGEKVIYGTQGICEVRGTTEKTIGKTKLEYYVLVPIYDTKSTIYIPVKNEKLLENIRKVLSETEINALIDTAAKNQLTWIEDDLKRKEICNQIFKSGDRLDIMRLIEMLYLRREALKQTKKHFHISDERYLREAERLIHDEFSYVLGIEQNKVPEYILNRINNRY